MSTAPWHATLTEPEHQLIFYFLVVAGLALFAGLIRTWTTRSEIGSRYRSAVVARLAVAAVATVSYAAIILVFQFGYTRVGAVFVPTDGAINLFALRFADWSVTVPLLTVELLAVCALVGQKARATGFAAMAGAFLMIFSGYLGAVIIGGGNDAGQLLLWSAISAVFWIFVNVILIRAVRASLPTLTRESAGLLRSATIVLLSGWVIYPLVYLIQVFAFGGQWTATMQITLSVADVLVKVGVGGLIHRVAKLRTAEDVRAGDDVHPESIWISSIKQSDAGAPREVYLAEESIVHDRRPKPPMTTAVAMHPEGVSDEGI